MTPEDEPVPDALRCRCVFSSLAAISPPGTPWIHPGERCPAKATAEDGLCGGCRSGDPNDFACRRYPHAVRVLTPQEASR